MCVCVFAYLCLHRNVLASVCVHACVCIGLRVCVLPVYVYYMLVRVSLCVHMCAHACVCFRSALRVRRVRVHACACVSNPQVKHSGKQIGRAHV